MGWIETRPPFEETVTLKTTTCETPETIWTIANSTLNLKALMAECTDEIRGWEDPEILAILDPNWQYENPMDSNESPIPGEDLIEYDEDTERDVLIDDAKNYLEDEIVFTKQENPFEYRDLYLNLKNNYPEDYEALYTLAELYIEIKTRWEVNGDIELIQLSKDLENSYLGEVIKFAKDAYEEKNTLMSQKEVKSFESRNAYDLQ